VRVWCGIKGRVLGTILAAVEKDWIFVTKLPDTLAHKIVPRTRSRLCRREGLSVRVWCGIKGRVLGTILAAVEERLDICNKTSRHASTQNSPEDAFSSSVGVRVCQCESGVA